MSNKLARRIYEELSKHSLGYVTGLGVDKNIEIIDKAIREHTEKRIYIFDDKDKAVAFALTARYVGHEATRIGSAVLCTEATYRDVLEKTYAIPAAIVAVEEEVKE